MLRLDQFQHLFAGVAPHFPFLQESVDIARGPAYDLACGISGHRERFDCVHFAFLESVTVGAANIGY